MKLKTLIFFTTLLSLVPLLFAYTLSHTTRKRFLVSFLFIRKFCIFFETISQNISCYKIFRLQLSYFKFFSIVSVIFLGFIIEGRRPSDNTRRTALRYKRLSQHDGSASDPTNVIY